MEEIKQDSVNAFDTLFTNNHIRMLKVLLPFVDTSMQRNLTVYIKLQELQYVLRNFHSSDLKSRESAYFHKKTANSDFNTICGELLPYCNDREKQQFNQFRNLIQTMQNLKNIMEMMETVKEFFPENMNGEGGIDPDMLSGLSGLFGGGNIDFSQMVDLFYAFQDNS